MVVRPRRRSWRPTQRSRRPTQRSGRCRETQPEVQLEAHTEVREGLEGPPGGSVGFGNPTRRSESGREAQAEVWEGSGGVG